MSVQKLECFAAGGAPITPHDFPVRPAVTELVFIGTHAPIDEVDRRLIEWRVTQMPAHAELWVLLFHEDSEAGVATQHAAPFARAVGAGVCSWSRAQVFSRFPALPQFLEGSSAYSQEEDVHLQRYYWMHMSLHLWLETLGPAFPRWRHAWRIEPDVLFSGNMSSLLAASARLDTDVLLPHYVRQAWDQRGAQLARRARSRRARQHRNESYYHWDSHEEYLRSVAPQSRLRSLVSIGRYSRRFLDLLYTRYWRNGLTMYEEILLPVACASAGPAHCRLGAWSHGLGLPSVRLATHFRFRPEHSCDDFVDALADESGEIWHPVKQRVCIVEALGLRDTGRRRGGAGLRLGRRRVRRDPDPADEEAD